MSLQASCKLRGHATQDRNMPATSMCRSLQLPFHFVDAGQGSPGVALSTRVMCDDAAEPAHAANAEISAGFPSHF